MAAASSGDPGGSGEQWPRLTDTSNGFGALTYLQLTGKDENSPLTSDPFIIGTSVEAAAGGPIEGASTEAQGTRYTLRVRNQAQVNKLLNMSYLSDGAAVSVKLHPTLNISRCVISCYEIIHMTEKNVELGLASQGVSKAQRIARKEHGKSVNTSALILTFRKSNYPSHVKIGLLRVPTRPYYPNPLLCYSCVRYGHPSVRCPGPKRCLNCSTEHELAEGEVCESAAHCINCGGAHRPINRQCPVFKKEMDVVRLKVDQNLTYPEARKRVEHNLESYAAAAAQQTADRRRIEELEKKMEQKDAQITQLLNEMKEKDDKYAKLLASFNMMQISIIQQTSPDNLANSIDQTQSAQSSEKPCQVSQSAPQMSRNMVQDSQSTQPTTSWHQDEFVKPKDPSGPAMQRCNNSHVVTQSKNNGKKNKKHNRSNNSSPDRQCPPLKKTSQDLQAPSGQEVMSTDDKVRVDVSCHRHHHHR